ncbi:tetratricopeptide repeat protein [Burkholderia sp. FERM BP-3421]|uniref:tetratricopeptide repeat protein n=1 Tax=Burkholderia sp. FERM BP-3421 TaxID=1494466 RepID=UPI00236194C6|nr:tetratricopeptide repeat protein [Burkholderia sp. FERM BP-3421]WDD90990.1 tetratricopeptide repeat protein [Burkholderia sp. FERM BP-3421]
MSSDHAGSMKPDTALTTAPGLLQPFLAFLRHAAAAQENGRSEARSIWLQAAAHLHGIDDDALAALRFALVEQRRYPEAIMLADAVVRLRPDAAAARFHLGYVLQLANRHRDALAHYRHAMTIDPDFPLLKNNLAAALRAAGGDLDEALELLESAAEAQPLNAMAWINLATARRDHLDLDGALDAGFRSVELAPDDAQALSNLALVLKEAQRWDEAEHYARLAYERAPCDPAMRLNLALLYLMRGNHTAGWPEHEARWEGSAELRGARPVFPKPQWQGESLAGKTVLVWGEQGMGDLLQFCRYIPMLAARVHREGGRVIWNSFPQMGALLSRSLGKYVDGYTAGGGVDSLPPFDYEIPLLSLPLVLGVDDETLSSTIPYLRPDAAARAAWRTRLAGEKRLKVGLAWTGNIRHQRNPFRRVGWERYADRFRDIDGVAFYSLQPGAADDVSAARAAGLAMTDHTAGFATFDDTAAFIGELDLVITICTSVAHLSGALGQRTWVLLDVNPHWPWLLGRRDSPWYPNTILYRQRSFAQWDAVLDEVARDLGALARRRG